jgi:hypothetical protein
MKRVHNTRVRTYSCSIALLLGLVVMAPSGISPEAAKPPVISLKAFTSVSEWILEITWHAKDSYEDQDCRAGVDMTASARYYLKRLDRQDGWGRWEAHEAQSSNITYTGSWLKKSNGERLDYRGTSAPLMGAVANFQVGGDTPGYQLVCQATFPVKVMPDMGVPMALMLDTTEMGRPPTLCAGPLPASGTAIHGSRVILASVGPFGTTAAPKTRLGIQYVLTPAAELAPLVPRKRGAP